MLLNEELVVSVGDQKISGSSTLAIYRHWGSEVAREHYHSKNLVHWDHFHEVGWDTNERLACSVSEMYSVWLTKQVSGFCGTNHMLNTIYGDVVDKCPNCGFSPERSQHMALCPETERTANSCVSHQFTSLLSG